MAQALFEALANGVTMDSQTALAVQSLLESQGVAEATSQQQQQQQVPVEEDDMFQCGKCKKQFNSLSAFVSHKQVRCSPQQVSHRPTQLPGTSHNSAFTANVQHTLNRQNQYSTVPPSPLAQLSQGMVLTDELMTFNIDQASLQVGTSIQGGGFGSQVTPQLTSSRSLTVTPVFGTVSTAGVFSSNNSAFTSTIPSNQIQTIQIQQVPGQSLSQQQHSPTQQQQQQQHQQQQQQQGIINQNDGRSSSLITKTTSRVISQLSGVKTSSTNGMDMITVVTDQDEIQAHPQILPTLKRRTKGGGGGLEDNSPRKKLKCQYCDKMFSKNFDLQQHVRSHTGEKPFQCIVCGRAFAQKSNVKKHMQTHKVWPSGSSGTLPKQPPPQNLVIVTEDGESQTVVNSGSAEHDDNQQPYVVSINAGITEATTDNAYLSPALGAGGDNSKSGLQPKVEIIIDNSYLCQYCPQKFKSYFQLKSHMTIHRTEQVYKCVLKTCGETFRELDAFLEHTKTHEEDMTYRCHMCNKQFPSLYELGVHQYSHSLYPNQGPKTGNREFKCPKCSNKYTSPEALQHHLQTSTHKYTCEFCAKLFTCERYLRRHLLIHGTGGEFECEVCHKKFKTEHYLKSHAVIHTGEKPFECEVCNAAFNRKDKLKRHMLIHENTKRFKCPFRNHIGCMKAFNRPDKLKAHIITHSGIKPFKCGECGKEFSRKPHLREHERGHRGEYKFHCQECGKGFTRSKLLHNHRCPIQEENEDIDSMDSVDAINLDTQQPAAVSRQQQARKPAKDTTKTTKRRKMITVTEQSIREARSKLPGQRPMTRRGRKIKSYGRFDSYEKKTTYAGESSDMLSFDSVQSRLTNQASSAGATPGQVGMDDQSGAAMETVLANQNVDLTSADIATSLPQSVMSSDPTLRNVQIIQDGNSLQIVVGSPVASEVGGNPTILVATTLPLDQAYENTDSVHMSSAYSQEDVDPVLQGTENMLRESAEILKSADHNKSY